jgi:hypothetical protein
MVFMHRHSRRTRTRRRQRGGADYLPDKPKAMCQCYGDDGKGCPNESVGNSAFCQKHENACPKQPLTGWEPSYKDLKRYDEPLEVRRSHNCYSAAMMVMDNKLIQRCKDSKNNTSACRANFHQPGARFGGRFELDSKERRNCSVVKKLVLQDNPDITETTFYGKCPPGTSKIAFMVHDKVDFHFEALLSNGKWGGKPGSNKTYVVDALGKPIFNPELSSHDYRWQGSELNYKFCGFLCVPRDRNVELGSGADEPQEQPQDGGHRRRRFSQKRASSKYPMVGLGWNDPQHLRRLSRRAARMAERRRQQVQQ